MTIKVYFMVPLGNYMDRYEPPHPHIQKWGPKLFLPVVLVKILKKYTNLLARDLNFINKIRGKRVYLKPMEFFACEF